MAHNQKNKTIKAGKQGRKQQGKFPQRSSVSETPFSLKLRPYAGLIIGIVAIVLYAKTISFDYVLDDKEVIKENTLIQQGTKAISKLAVTNRLYGYKGSFVREYRPASLIVFALEWQYFPNNAKVAHAVNVLLYAFTCYLLFLLLSIIFRKQNIFFPFIGALLFTTLPVHTEVVSNIKSLDEILCFMFAVITMLYSIRYIEKKSISFLLLSGVFYFLSLWSKESGITFLVLIPLLLYFFTEGKSKQIITSATMLAGVSAVYLIIRARVLASAGNAGYESILGNTLLAAPDVLSRYATAFYILLKYIGLLIFPFHLSYDYSFSQIPIQGVTSIPALAGFLVYFAAFAYAIYNIGKKSVWVFGILFYLVTISPVSNLFFLLGATMGERFLYIPSLGFCLLLANVLGKVSQFRSGANGVKVSMPSYKANSSAIILATIILVFYSLRTFSRSKDWKDNITLYSHDVEIASNSAKAHYNLGTVLLLGMASEADKSRQDEILIRAIKEFEKATSIFPQYADAYGNLGYAFLQTKEYDKVINVADSAIKYQPDYADAYNTKGCALYIKGDFAGAIPAFEKAVELNPQLVMAYKNTGLAYINIKQYEKSLPSLKKANELDPSDSQTVYFLAVASQNTGDSAKAKEYFNQVEQMKKGAQ